MNLLKSSENLKKSLPVIVAQVITIGCWGIKDIHVQHNCEVIELRVWNFSS